MDAQPVDLFLYRHAASLWESVVRPWFEAATAFAGRSWVVVPSRGQAQAWKQYCLERALPLLGVEFLTPGLARHKWLAHGGFKPAIMREMLLTGLEREADALLAADGLEEADRSLLLSLKTDMETALDDFDALLRAGYGPEAFPWPVLTRVFAKVVGWVESLDLDLAPRQAIAAANAPASLEGRVLVLGLGPESWGEFPNVMALVRRCASATVVLPEPELRGGRDVDERWIAAWEAALGVDSVPVDAPEPQNCGSAVTGWLPGADGDRIVDWTRVSYSIFGDKNAEGAGIVDGVRSWLAEGAAAIAVVFPGADASYLAVRSALGSAGVVFRDEIGSPGLPSPERECQRALLALWHAGGRWPELVALWPHAVRTGKTPVALHEFRRSVQRWFDSTQTLAIADALHLVASAKGEAAVALQSLLPDLQLDWPEEMTLLEVIARCELAWDAWQTGAPEGWEALRAFAHRDLGRQVPSRWFALVQRFLAEPGPERKPVGSATFARVVLTTRRRAEGAPWSHVWLAEANAGHWPERRESSCWLPDDARTALSKSAPHGLAVYTADERSWLERCGYARLARDTSVALRLSAALSDPADPETELEPNSWLERLLWQSPERGANEGLESAYRRFASPALPRLAVPAQEVSERASVIRGRHDPERPLDEYLFSLRTQSLRPKSAAARVVEAALEDPLALWFEEVLGETGQDWQPLQRARRKWVGQTAHELVARALRGEPAGGIFRRRPSLGDAKSVVVQAAAELRSRSKQNAYWESCYAEAEGVAVRLLERAYSIPNLPPYVAVEFGLPPASWVDLRVGGPRLGLRGRIDAAFADQPEWQGATVDVVDFKTGVEGGFSVEGMARGRSVQLGLYLAAVRNLGAVRGRVWMVRPGLVAPRSLGMEDLETGLAGLSRIALHLDSGKYGALTADRSPYSTAGIRWPLACAPIPQAILKARFERTFPELAAGETEAEDA